MANASSAREGSLTKALSAASRSIHDVRSSFLMSRLVVLFTDRHLYGRALSCFVPVFRALEQEVGRHISAQHDGFHEFVELLGPSGSLLRANAFQEDVQFFLGQGWEAKYPPPPAVTAYIAHIQRLSQSHPQLLLAHVYTQHLGMLAGGQVIRRWARKLLELPETGEGTAGFEFKASPPSVRFAFTKRLDALGAGLTDADWQQMLDEHVRAFNFNNEIIRTFKIGWGPFFMGLFKLIPGPTRLSLLLVCAAAVHANGWKAPGIALAVVFLVVLASLGAAYMVRRAKISR